MFKIIIILVLFLSIFDITSASDCAFGLCNVHDNIVGNKTENAKNIIIDIVKYFLSFLALVGIAFVIKGGFQIMSAAGDDEKLKSGRKTIFYALIGIFVVINAYYIVSIGFQAGDGIDKIAK